MDNENIIDIIFTGEHKTWKRIWRIIRYPIGAIPYIVGFLIVAYDWQVTYGIPEIPESLINKLSSTRNPLETFIPTAIYSMTPKPQLLVLSIFGVWALWYSLCKVLKYFWYFGSTCRE